MKANQPYEYRVKAVNAGGESKPSPSTGVIKAKPLKEAPKFDLSGLFGAKDIKVKVGEPLKIAVGCQGSPTPTVTWLCNGKPIVDGPKVIEVIILIFPDEQTTILVKVVDRFDFILYHLLREFNL